MATPTNVKKYSKFETDYQQRQIYRYRYLENRNVNHMFDTYQENLTHNNAEWLDDPKLKYENQQNFSQQSHWQHYDNQRCSYTQFQKPSHSSNHLTTHRSRWKLYGQEMTSSNTQSSLLQQRRNEIEALFTNNVLQIQEQHQKLINEQQTLLADMDENDQTRFQSEEYLQELRNQLKTFEQAIDHLYHMNPLTLNHAQYLLNRLRREIDRLRARLPIYACHQRLIETIKNHQVIILKADTGSGKSSQLVQYLADAGFANHGQIVCSQPRRLAARELAARVTKEFGCKVGCRVGVYQPNISPQTQICFVTDAVLLSEYQRDPMLSAYTVIIVDEAHERHVDTDLLFGVMKLCVRKRHDLKLIVMSATLDDNLLSKYYNNAYFIEIPGRAYPIKDIYAMEDAENYVDEAVNKVLEIHRSGVSGDILVFLTGQDDISRAIDEVNNKIGSSESVLVLPLHGKLNEDEIQTVFMAKNNSNQRKIIFSTNVAETSVTIDGIEHVIDSGMVKEVMWDSKRQIRILKIGYTTQSSIKQRRGRAGRTAPGTCYHLYTYETYQTLDVCSRAEILCIQPSIAVLKLKHLDIVEDITEFDWLERPTNQSLQETVKRLTWLGAIDFNNGKLTDVGRHMAKLGLEPMVSMMILTGKKLDCLSHILALVGMLSVVHNIWWRGDTDQTKQACDEIQMSFTRDSNMGGDFITLIRIFFEWYNAGEKISHRKAWCFQHMIRWKSMIMAHSVVKELIYQIDSKFRFQMNELNDELIERIVRCVCAGFFQNLAISNGPIRAGYQLVSSTTDTIAHIHRSSIIKYAQPSPKFILYHGIININEANYLSVICPIELNWLNQSWLDSLPRSPLECAFDNYTFVNIGPSLLNAVVGKKCKKVPELEEQLHVLFEVDHAQSKLSIWGQADKLSHAQQYLQNILNKEREKLRNQLQEFQIIGSTRILLGPGAQPRLALIDDEYSKIFLKNLPKTVTEEQIQQKCKLYGQVYNVSLIRTSYNNSSAYVTFDTVSNAQMAVTKLSCEKWDDYQICVNPSYTRTTVDTNKQKYQLRVQWFLTESECNGRVVYTKLDRAKQAYQLLTSRYHYRCQFETSLVNTLIKCSWPFKQHYGHAIVNFHNGEQAQQALEATYEHPFHLQRSRRANNSIYVRRIPSNLDEFDLKKIFIGSTYVVLLRNRADSTMPVPIDTEDNISQLFDCYSSFQRESIFIEPYLHDGRIIAYIQFSDEEEMRRAVDEINRRQETINAGLVRVSIQEQRQVKSTKKATHNRENEFRIKIYRLQPHIDERLLNWQLNQNNISDSISYVTVYRKKLPDDYFSNRSKQMTEEKTKALSELKSLFADRHLFLSEPDIDIRSPSEDGRAVAYIRFNDPRDMLAAINIYDKLDNSTMNKIALKQLHIVPIIIHKISINQTLAEVIHNKIEQTIRSIQTNSDFCNVSIFKKSITKDEKTDHLIVIRGTNIQQTYKVRIIFDNLLKGLPFQLHDQTWVTALSDSRGQSFLQDLQNQTSIYIWWNWKSTLLRIFGEDAACQEACTQINKFIQATISQRQHTISIAIPKDAIRQCIKDSNVFRSLNTQTLKVVFNMIRRVVSISGDQDTVVECEQKIKQYLAKLSLNSSEHTTINMNNTCPICSCDYDSPYRLEQCGHTFCRSCLSAYFDSFVDVTLSYAAFKLSCPFHNCDELCLIRDIVSVIGFERMARLATIAFQYYIRRTDNDLCPCIGMDCKQVYRPSKHSSTYFCDQCVKFYCIPCKVEYHIGMTCEQYKRLHEDKDEGAILEYNLGRLPYKPCPKCRAPIDKYAGCNAVKCTLCDIRFCWRCGATDDVDIHNHFMDPNSPCYNLMLDDDVVQLDFQ